jgi:hypothetical protein
MADQTLFFTLLGGPDDEWSARLLIDSVRTFGGPLRDSPFWVFLRDPEKLPGRRLEGTGVRLIPLQIDPSYPRYVLGSKVYASAQAEALAGPGVESLVYLTPQCLVTQPPVLLDLGDAFDVAIRPVHIQNVGLTPAEPLDGFWSGVYQAVGVTDVDLTVESFVEGQRIRAYYNSGAYAVNPAWGLFRRWRELFLALVRDETYQRGPCQDERHQIFLHQAVLSALIAATIAPARIRLLPPTYGYPLHLHHETLPSRQAQALDDLVCIIYEELLPDPERLTGIAVREPLRSWLSDHFRERPPVLAG